NTIGYTTSNLSWNATNGSTVYAYATIGANGAMTPGTTTLAPIYQWGGTPAVTNGQFTFNISEMRGYMGNGSTAPQANIVFFGEITASGGNITGTVMYAYNGRFPMAWVSPLPALGSLTIINHNLGVDPEFISPEVIAQCTTNDNGYVVGDQLH